MGSYSWIVNCSHLTKSNVDLTYCHSIHNIIQVQTQAMLNKVAIMTLVIRYVKIIFHDHVNALIMWIKVWVFHRCNVDKNGDLVVMLVHGLHFFLNIKVIVFCKIYHRNYSIIYKILKARLEHCILPSCHKIMVGKVLKFGL
jgi:hypothetical protein